MSLPPSFYVSDGVLNLGFHVCIEAPFSTEPSVHLSNGLFFSPR